MFKDYYSILGVTFPASDEELMSAYKTKSEEFCSNYIEISDPNYQERVDVEEAFRVLCSSYSLKTAYDKEYLKAIYEGWDKYEIKDEWLKNSINDERRFVTNRVLSPKRKEKRTWKDKMRSCLGKALLYFLLLLILSYVKTCSKKSFSNSQGNKNAYVSEKDENPEIRLRRVAMEINDSLSQCLDEGYYGEAVIQAVLIESDALVYVYKVEDGIFAAYKDYLLSRDCQLENIRKFYNEMKLMIDLLIETHRGISYRYICKKSGKTFECKIPYIVLAGL